MSQYLNEWQKRFGTYHGSVITLAVERHGALVRVDETRKESTVSIVADDLLSLIDCIVDGATKKYERHILEQNKIVAEQEALIQKFKVMDKEQMSEEMMSLKCQIEDLTGQLKAMASLKESVIASTVQHIKE